VLSGDNFAELRYHPHMSRIGTFTEDAVSRLSGVSEGQLRAWRKNGFLIPSVLSTKGVPYGHLYSFQDVAALRVLNGLRNESKCQMAHLRDVREKLSGLGNDKWIRTRLYVVNREVVFVPEGVARPESVLKGQGVLTVVLADVIEDLETAVRKMNARDPLTFGKVSRSRHVMRNKPVIAGTRIEVSTIMEWLDAGYSKDRIIREYPDLTYEDIDAAAVYDTPQAA